MISLAFVLLACLTVFWNPQVALVFAILSLDLKVKVTVGGKEEEKHGPIPPQ